MSEEKFQATQISSSAEGAEQSLLALLKTVDLQGQCYAYKSRVKPWKNLINKVELKRLKKPEYCLNDVTDVLGLRIVTLFRQDMVDVIEIILSLISHQLPFNPIPFRKNRLLEAIIYSPLDDDLVISHSRQKIDSFKLTPVKMVSSAARYSSIHLVAEMDYTVPEVNDSYRVPIEIQIRTVFEDAWGELDHKYGYQNREGKSDNVITNPIHVEKNLLTMKKFVDSCSEYADNIRELATESSMDMRTAKPLDTDELITKNLKLREVPKQVISEYMKVREIRSSASEAENKSQMYLKAAENFNKLLEQVKTNSLITNKEGFRVYFYYIKMDEALCRLSTSEMSEIKKAITIYRSLIKAYPSYPVILFRLGQSLIRLKSYNEARKQLKKCRTNINRFSKFSEDKRLVKLPNIELKKIQVTMHLLLGFAYWKEANDTYIVSPKSRRVQSYFEQAFEQSKVGLSIDGLLETHRVKFINNMVFYALEMVHFKRFYNNKTNVYKTFINEHISVLEENINVKESKNVNSLDTLMNCYVYTSKKEKAIEIASRLEKLNLEQSIDGGAIESDVLKRVNSLLNAKK